MPLPSRIMIRLSLCYLMLGITFGALLLIHKAIGLHPMAWIVLPLHIESLFWGFIIQFTMGTAHWMLPRYLEGPARGNPGLCVAMVVMLNIGMLATLVRYLPFLIHSIVITGRVLELFAIGIFAYLHWGRIVSYRNM